MKIPLLISATSAALFLMAAGCSPGGDPDPMSPFPQRPRDVSITGIDPCAVFTDVQQERLGLRKATASQATVNGMPSAGCVWLGKSEIGYNTQTIPIGAEVAATDPSASVIQVNGFGAVRNVVRELTGGAPTCQVTIDAAAGESIRIQARAAPRPPLPTDDEMCRLATDAASMVITTVTGSPR